MQPFKSIDVKLIDRWDWFVEVKLSYSDKTTNLKVEYQKILFRIDNEFSTLQMSIRVNRDDIAFERPALVELLGFVFKPTAIWDKRGSALSSIECSISATSLKEILLSPKFFEIIERNLGHIPIR